jgi:hypothetical protein
MLGQPEREGSPLMQGAAGAIRVLLGQEALEGRRGAAGSNAVAALRSGGTGSRSAPNVASDRPTGLGDQHQLHDVREPLQAGPRAGT